MIASSRDRDAIVSRARARPARTRAVFLWPIIRPPPLSYAATLTESLVRS